jgi:hypothetical protein
MLEKLLKNCQEISITTNARRTEIDSTGKDLPEGRDWYGLWNYRIINSRKL